MYIEYLEKLNNVLQQTVFTLLNENRLIKSDCETAFSEILNLLLSIKSSGKKIFFIGNGGSCAIAEHMTADFMKNGGMRTVNLFQAPLITCMGNDYGYDQVYSNPISLLGDEGDLLITISSSGNSLNIINAINAARGKSMKILTLSGFKSDNQSRQLGDANIYVPIEHYGIVESIHNLLLQLLVDCIVEKGKA